MLTELVECGHQIEEKVKARQSELKENVQGTNSDEKETRTQINCVDQKEEINIQPEQNEETRIQNTHTHTHTHTHRRRGLGTYRTTLMFQHPNHRGARGRKGRAKS